MWLDAQPAQTTATEFHANFRPNALSGNLALSRAINGQPMLLDYLNYSVALPGESYGSFPNGYPFARRAFFFTTPNASNNAAAAPVSVFINEWMPDNTWTLADAADGQFEDWFELYNSSTNYADLAGYYLTDTLTNQFQYAIPAGYVIPPGGHLLVWADGESSQNSPTNSDLHVDFKLGKTGEAIGFFAPDGSAIDTVTFGAQTSDISEGRYPDGNSLVFFMSNSTPRAPNLLSLPNLPPVIAPIAPQVVTENNWVTFTVNALDINYPPQNLTFSLGANAPSGAQIDPVSGHFTWQAGAVSRPTTNFVTITVTDDGDPVQSADSTAAVVVIPTIRVDSIRRFRDWVMISWTVFPGKVYQVQYTEELPPNTWINFGQPTSAASGSLTITDSKNAVHQRFYRVVQLN